MQLSLLPASKKYAENKVAGCSSIFNGILMALEPRGAEAAAQPTRKNVLAHGENSSMF